MYIVMYLLIFTGSVSGIGFTACACFQNGSGKYVQRLLAAVFIEAVPDNFIIHFMIPRYIMMKPHFLKRLEKI